MSEPKVSALRGLARRASWALGVPDLLYRLQERRMARAAPKGPAVHDGLPLPPALMRVMVIGTASSTEFLEGGKAHVDEFEAVLADQGRSFAAARAILDIGCGCGRLARWVIRRGGEARISGVDINRPMVAWCRRNLPGRWQAIRIGQDPVGGLAFDLQLQRQSLGFCLGREHRDHVAGEGRRRRAEGAAVEQRNVEFLFQLGDRLADGLLRNADRLGRQIELTVLDNRQKMLKFPWVHRP